MWSVHVCAPVLFAVSLVCEYILGLLSDVLPCGFAFLLHFTVCFVRLTTQSRSAVTRCCRLCVLFVSASPLGRVAVPVSAVMLAIVSVPVLCAQRNCWLFQYAWMVPHMSRCNSLCLQIWLLQCRLGHPPCVLFDSFAEGCSSTPLAVVACS